MSGDAIIDRSPRIGVGVTSFGDAAALKVTLAALRRLGNAIHQVLIVEQVTGPRPRPAERFGARVIEARRYENPHAMIVADMAPRSDLLVLLREGLVPDAEMIGDVLRAFAGRPGLAACLLRSEWTLTRATDGPAGDIDDGPALVAVQRSRWASRYFAPAILCLASPTAAAGAFEIFGRRSDWASYRLYADNVAAMGLVSIETTSDHFASFADPAAEAVRPPDGRRIYGELTRLANAYDRYKPFVRRDMRRIVMEQVASILRGSSVGSRLSFLRGFLTEARADARLRRRLRRDIAALG